MGIVKNQKVTMRWNSVNKKYYEAKGYAYTKMKDEFQIDYKDLPEHSKQPVLCICDFCGNEFYHKYVKVKIPDENPDDKIACPKCRGKLTAFRLMQKYGPDVDNVAKIPHVKEKIIRNNIAKYGAPNIWGSEYGKNKIKETNIARYGTPNPQQNPEIKAKTAKTNLDRYGAENIFASEYGKQKIKETCLDRYGKENYVQTDEFWEKYAKTSTERYGVSHPSQSPVIQEKTKQVCLDKYNTEFFFQSEIFKEKSKATCLERYNKEYYVQTDEFKEKSKQTSLKHYNCENPGQSIIVRQKKLETFRSHDYNVASKPQKHYNELFNGFLDYPVYGCLLDIAFPEDKIYVECDFKGHFYYSRASGLSELDMLYKDAKRDNVIVANGWKCIRYLNRSNDFPTDNDMILLNQQLVSVLKTTNFNRILVDLNYRIVRFEPSFLFKSIDVFLR